MHTWTDQGIILHVRPLGERTLLVHLLTEDHGLIIGAVRRTKRSVSLGLETHIAFQSRIQDHMGRLSFEPIVDHVSPVLFQPVALSSLRIMLSFLKISLPESHAYPHIYRALRLWVQHMHHQTLRHHLLFEIRLLQYLGFGLDLSKCVLGGNPDTLCWVSPKSGKAVSAEKGAAYADALLPLPSFLLSGKDGTKNDIVNGLRLSAYFLEKHFAEVPFYTQWATQRMLLETYLS